MPRRRRHPTAARCAVRPLRPALATLAALATLVAFAALAALAAAKLAVADVLAVCQHHLHLDSVHLGSIEVLHRRDGKIARGELDLGMALGEADVLVFGHGHGLDHAACAEDLLEMFIVHIPGQVAHTQES